MTEQHSTKPNPLWKILQERTIGSTVSVLQRQLADEVELMHQCLEWLEQLARGEQVMINLCAKSDRKTSYVGIDHA